MTFDEAYTHLVLETIRSNNETSTMIQSRGNREFIIPSIDLNRGLARCDTEAKVLLYCYTCMYAHYDAYLHVLRTNAKIVNDHILRNNEQLLFIDFGCGPLTSGLALADYYKEIRTESLILSYIGIDHSEAMLAKAKEFCEYNSIFGSGSDFSFIDSWNKIDFTQLHGDLSNDKLLVLNFSYFFGQELSLDVVVGLSAFVKRVRTEFQRNKLLFIYLNASNRDANKRYRYFKKELLGLSEYIQHCDKVPTRKMQALGQLKYDDPTNKNVCYEMLFL